MKCGLSVQRHILKEIDTRTSKEFHVDISSDHGYVLSEA